MSNNRKRKRSDDDSDDESDDYKRRKVVKKTAQQTPRARSVIEIEDPVAEETPYERAKKALHLSYAPQELLGREKEKEEIVTFLKNKLDPKTRESAPSSLYISGPPGTGKTQLTTKLCAEIKSWKIKQPFRVVIINCMKFDTTETIFTEILHQIDGSRKTAKRAITVLEERFKEDTHMTILVLDEIDQLVKQDPTVLYQLFEWPSLEDSKLVLIGIANALDMTERLLPRLRSKGLEPQLIHFTPYKTDQITSIVKQRLGDLVGTMFGPRTIELVARKVESVSGDLRKVLDICNNAVALAEKQHRRLKATELTPVRIEHVKQVMDRSLGSPIVAVIKGLPMHQKFALCGTVLANRVNKNSKMSDVWDQYSSLLRSNNLKGVLTTEFYEMCKDLMSYSLISIEGKNKDERMKTVRLTVNENDVVFALKEDTFLGEVLGTNGDVNA